jgi:hypothetical protein
MTCLRRAAWSPFGREAYRIGVPVEKERGKKRRKIKDLGAGFWPQKE